MPKQLSEDDPDYAGFIVAPLSDEAQAAGFSRPIAGVWLFNKRRPNVVLCCHHRGKHYHVTMKCDDASSPEYNLAKAVEYTDQFVCELLEAFLALDEKTKALLEVTSDHANQTKH